jgi:hypothetical protein
MDLEIVEEVDKFQLHRKASMWLVTMHCLTIVQPWLYQSRKADVTDWISTRPLISDIVVMPLDALLHVKVDRGYGRL